MPAVVPHLRDGGRVSGPYRFLGGLASLREAKIIRPVRQSFHDRAMYRASLPDSTFIARSRLRSRAAGVFKLDK